MDHLFIRGSMFVLIGAIVLAVGGVMTTLGWNILSERSQIRNLISAVARQWEINNKLLTADPLFNGSDEEVLKSHRLYPRFYTNATDAVLASGLFNPKDKADREFLRMIADYQSTINDVNSRLGVSDGFVTSTRDLNDILAHRRLVLESAGFQGLLLKHTATGKFLKTYYGWADAQFLD